MSATLTLPLAGDDLEKACVAIKLYCYNRISELSAEWKRDPDNLELRREVLAKMDELRKLEQLAHNAYPESA